MLIAIGVVSSMCDMKKVGSECVSNVNDCSVQFDGGLPYSHAATVMTTRKVEEADCGEGRKPGTPPSSNRSRAKPNFRLISGRFW